MAYDDFLAGFARAQKLDSVETLLTDHAVQYRFQIRSRDRAQAFIRELRGKLDYDFAGKRVLDVGCAYGSFSIELAHAGAEVTGIDVSEKWLRLAELNAKDDADVRFVHEDASSRAALSALAGEPYDLIVLSDVLEHVYDTAGLLHNLRALLKDDGLVYFKVPNGLATSHVLEEGHKKAFGVSLLAPDFWPPAVKPPFSIYYRRLEHYEALFTRFGFRIGRWITFNRDRHARATTEAIQSARQDIETALASAAFASDPQEATMRDALRRYFDEMDQDLQTLDSMQLFLKYRATFWEGLLTPAEAAAEQHVLKRESLFAPKHMLRWVQVRLPVIGRALGRRR